MAPKSAAKKKRPWRSIAQEAQQHRDASIARVQPNLPQTPANLPIDVTKVPGTILSQDEVQITEMLPEDLVSALASGGLSAVAVTKAFLRRAGLAQKLVCTSGHEVLLPALIQTGRPTVLQNSCLSEPWPGPSI